MRNSKEIIDIIKKRRKELDISQRELARITGVSHSAISRYEKYEREFPINDAPVFAKALNLNLNNLIGINDKKDNLPDHFNTPEEAMNFLLHQQVVMGFNGLDITKLSEEDQVSYANEVLNMMKLVSLKYKDKK